jgi:hypothetical protein
MLKKVSSYEQGDMIKKGGGVTMPGSTDPVAGAADICAQLLSTAAKRIEAVGERLQIMERSA